MNQDTKVKIFFGILLVFGLYIVFRNMSETFVPWTGSTPWTTASYYDPYRRKTLVGVSPYHSYYPYYYPYSSRFEDEYQNFMRNRIAEDWQLGVYETYD